MRRNLIWATLILFSLFMVTTTNVTIVNADLVAFEFRDDANEGDGDTPDRSFPFDGGETNQGQIGANFLGFIDVDGDRNFDAADGDADSTLRLSIVDIIGQTGSRASDGNGHESNIAGNQDALAVNDGGDGDIGGGTDSSHFNPGEALELSFDQDVFFNFIQFESSSADTEFVLSSGGNSIVFDGADGNQFDVRDQDFFIAAGDTFTLAFTDGNTNGDADSDLQIRVESFSVHVPAVPEPNSLALVAGLGVVGLMRRRKRA